MKKVISFLCCMFLLISVCLPAFAAEQDTMIAHQETNLGDGITVIEEITECAQTRASGKTYNRTNTYMSGDTVIAVITLQATFYYDGTSVVVASKSVIQADTYDGWSFEQQSLTSSGGTVTLTGKLTKWLILNKSVDMSITCDKDGNITL